MSCTHVVIWKMQLYRLGEVAEAGVFAGVVQVVDEHREDSRVHVVLFAFPENKTGRKAFSYTSTGLYRPNPHCTRGRNQQMETNVVNESALTGWTQATSKDLCTNLRPGVQCGLGL